MLVAIGAVWPAPIARGVIIDSLTGTGNTSAPADNPGWANVGVRGAGTGVYLGDGWVLTASHVGAGSIVLGGTTYQVEPNTAFTLTNGGAANKTANTDLVMFRLATDPGLPMLPIAATTPGNGVGVTMIGAGRDRGRFAAWSINTSTNPDTWTEVPTSGTVSAAGYFWDTSRTKRWGTNTTSGAGWINAGYGDSFTLSTNFSYAPGDSFEAQAAEGDSGGATFRKNGATWELAGIMLAVNSYSGQPAETAVYNNSTFSADLSFYRPQIMAVVPEPATGTLAVAGATAAALAWLRRRRRSRGGHVSPALTAPAGR